MKTMRYEPLKHYDDRITAVYEDDGTYIGYVPTDELPLSEETIRRLAIKDGLLPRGVRKDED